MNPPTTDAARATASEQELDLDAYCQQLARTARHGSKLLRRVSGQQKDDWLRASAHQLRAETDEILKANAIDVGRADEHGLTSAQVDRLKLDAERIAAIADGLEEISGLPDPIGEIIEGSVRPNGLQVSRVRVPIGVIFFIYESRPNVTADAAAICMKSGNSVVLRGGKEAAASSRAIIEVLQGTAKQCGLPAESIQLVEPVDRGVVTRLLAMKNDIDLVIPRGGPGLIQHVSQHAKMPVIKHESGICHVYVDASADLAMAQRIVVNSKCQRPGVCNACESLLVHADVAEAFLSELGEILVAQDVEIRGDERTRQYCSSAVQITDEDDTAEYLDKIISIRVVDSMGDAIEHIERFGSQHTDTIVTRDWSAARRFCNEVDSSAVMVNSSTRLNDGSALGLGAEIGISTDRLHARGPCGIRELTTYKYVCLGDGQVR